MSTTDIIGYIASVLLIVSFALKDVKKIRLVNMIGCIIFVWYAYRLEAWPVLIPNAMIVLVQIYHLFIAKEKQK